MSDQLQNSPEIFLNLNVRGLPQSATLAINEKCQKLEESGRHIYKLGLGQSPFPVPEPVVQALRANAHRKQYLPVKGLPELRSSVANYYHRTQGIECSGEDVLIGPGSKELMFLIQLVYYGDLVIPTPSWVSYAPQANIIGRHVRWLPTDADNDWRLTADELEMLCQKDLGRPRIVILNYPANPTGRTYSEDELKSIAKVARNNRVVLLSDEIYGELHHDGQHISIARFYPEGTIVSGGLSKWCGAGGWRLGTFVFPKSLHWLMDAMAVVASETYTSTSAPIQYAAVRAFHGGIRIERYLWNSRRILKALGDYIAENLKVSDIKVSCPQGAFYLF
ncbi:MAG: pyridoxal phosphate-dependent aminotransferase, partial [Calditrichota bacterium]